jgi:hypothetical protein
MSFIPYRLDVLRRAFDLDAVRKALPSLGGEDEEKITLAELRRRLGRRYGREPHPKTIYEAVRRGMPCEPHELINGRWVYPWLRCLAWLKDQREPKPLPRALVGALKAGVKTVAKAPGKRRR